MPSRTSRFKMIGLLIGSGVLILNMIPKASLALGTKQVGTIHDRAHGLAMHGTLKNKPNFKHYSYVNPAAPIGGTLKMGLQGSFDSLNPLIIKGNSAANIRGFVYETLMSRDLTEAFSLYCLICESVETNEDRSMIIFRIRKEARFSDNKPIRPQDVLFSFKLLRDEGRPNHRTYYKKVAKATLIDGNGIKFDFKAGGDRELPLILGLMPILPEHDWKNRPFQKTTLRPPIGSGPYAITNIDVGKSVTYTRRKDYWGWHLPYNKGRFNFDKVRYDYYRNNSSMFEAFKSGLIDVWYETDPSRWYKLKNSRPVLNKSINALDIPLKIPAGMKGLAFNLRKAPFDNQLVRRALIKMFDFTWMNRNLYHGQYTRTHSFFDRSYLSSVHVDPSPFELSLLAPYQTKLKPSVLKAAPDSKTPVSMRRRAREAVKLLSQAGFKLQKGMMVDSQTGTPLTIDVMASNKAQERYLLTYAVALKKIGIRLTVSQVDSAQYQQRKTNYNYQMVEAAWPASLSPGNEQLFRWSSAIADQSGSYNYAGIKSPAVDKMIDHMLKAKTNEQFVDSVRALDRTLRSGDYVLPLFYAKNQWVGVNARLGIPRNHSNYGVQLDSWWVKQAP